MKDSKLIKNLVCEMVRRIKKRRFLYFIIILICVTSIDVYGKASDSGVLNIHTYDKSGEIRNGIRYKVYRVRDYDDSKSRLVDNRKFVDYYGGYEANMKNVYLLESYIEDRNIVEDYALVSVNGQALLENLSVGRYFVMEDSDAEDKSVSFFFSVSSRNISKSIEAYPKVDKVARKVDIHIDIPEKEEYITLPEIVEDEPDKKISYENEEVVEKSVENSVVKEIESKFVTTEKGKTGRNSNLNNTKLRLPKTGQFFQIELFYILGVFIMLFSMIRIFKLKGENFSEEEY